MANYKIKYFDIRTEKFPNILKNKSSFESLSFMAPMASHIYGLYSPEYPL